MGLPPSATSQEVRKAYRALARKWHPDLNPAQDANEKFRLLQLAYETLISNKPQQSYEQVEEWRRQRAEAIAQRRKEMREAYLRKKALEDELYFKKVKRFVLGFFSVFVALAFLGPLRFMYLKHQVNQDADSVLCQVVGLNYRIMTYRYKVNGKLFHGKIRTRKSLSQLLAGNGMPLGMGDVFMLRYSKKHPEKSYPNYKWVDENTLQGYFEKVEERARSLSVDWKDCETCTRCLVHEVYKVGGLEGLSSLYFHSTSPLENIRHNHLRWVWIKQRTSFQTLMGFCKAHR